jgi:hypothetical protein
MFCGGGWIDVRTHPPLQVAFPPRQSKGKFQDSQRDESESESDDARDATCPRTPRPCAAELAAQTPTQSHSRGPPAPTTRPRAPSMQTLRHYGSAETNFPSRRVADERCLSARDVVAGASPYVTLDGAGVSAFSPSHRASLPSPMRPAFPPSVIVSAKEKSNRNSGVEAGEVAQGGRFRVPVMQQLPNPTMNFDLRTLNLHLAVRTTEVLACAEAMWEWVLDYQRVWRERLRARGRSGSVDGLGGRARRTGVSGGVPGTVAAPPADTVLDAIAELNRADFDGLLSKFDL